VRSMRWRTAPAWFGSLRPGNLDVVDPSRTPPIEVAGKAFGDEAARGMERRELVGSRARRILRKPSLAPVAATLVFLHKHRIDNMDFRHHRKEDRRWLLQLELDSMIVHHLSRTRLYHRLEHRGCALADR